MPPGPQRKLCELKNRWLEIPVQTSSSKSPVGKRQNSFSGVRLWDMWKYLSVPWKYMPGVNSPNKPHTDYGSSVTEALSSSRETAGNTWLLCDQNLISYGYHLVLICLCCECVCASCSSPGGAQSWESLQWVWPALLAKVKDVESWWQGGASAGAANYTCEKCRDTICRVKENLLEWRQSRVTKLITD